MTSQKSTLVLWTAMALYIAGIVIAYLIFRDNWTAVQTWAVILAGFVIIWYTWETRQLREAAFAQRELQLRPFIVVEPQKNNFVVSNVGSGVAVNVRINEIIIDKEFEISVRFPDSIPVLRSGEEVPIHAESFRQGHPAGDFFLAHLDSKYANREIEIRVEFQNVEMTPYSVSERVLPERLQIKGFS